MTRKERQEARAERYREYADMPIMQLAKAEYHDLIKEITKSNQ